MNRPTVVRVLSAPLEFAEVQIHKFQNVSLLFAVISNTMFQVSQSIYFSGE